jgi:hypothetical protein
MKNFWLKWRREIVRGGFLFLAVVGVGMFVVSAIRRGTTRFAQVRERFGLNGDWGSGFDPGGDRRTGDTWVYSAKLAPGQWLWIRNTNGSVRVSAAGGDSVEVRAVKTYRHSDPAGVRVISKSLAGGVAVCALWTQDDSSCQAGGGIRASSSRRSDVAVDFEVRVPRGVRVGASTIHGGVMIRGATARVVAAAVDGAVDAETANGPVDAVSVNGNVRASMRAFGDTGEVNLFTVNGEAIVELPAALDASLEAGTVNGSIETDYPLAVSGKFTSRHLSGTVGAGGRRVHVQTVNGSIAIKKVGAAPAETPTPRPGRSVRRSAS